MNKYRDDSVTVNLVKRSTSKRLIFISGGAEFKSEFGKDRVKFLIEIDGRQLDYIPNKTSIGYLCSAWGTDSNKWMGNQAALKIETINGKEAVIASPVLDNGKNQQLFVEQ